MLKELGKAFSLALTHQKRHREHRDVFLAFRGLLNNIPYAVILLDSNGRWLLANQRAEEFFGLKRPLREKDLRWLVVIRPEKRTLLEKIKEGLDKALSGKFRGNVVFEWQEEKKWWEFCLIPLRQDEEKRALLLVRDITPFRLAEKRLETVLEHLPFMVYLVEPQSRKVLWANARFKEYCGHKALEGKSCHEILFGRKEPCAFCHLKEPNPAYREEKEILDPKRERWLKFYEAYIPWIDKPLLRLGVFEDITDLKRQEEGLVRLQKMELLGKMAGSLAHEFNNMLAVINGYLELIQLKAAEDAKIAGYLSQIRRAIEAGKALVKELLILSHAKAPRKRETCNLNQVIREQKELFQKLLGEQVELKVGLSPEPLTVGLSYEELQHLLTNLLVNAKDAMPRGGEVKITTKLTETPDGKAAFLRVEDTGCGIPPERLNRIFDPFYTTKTSGEGTGLGLNVVLSLTQRAEGKIEVKSKPGRGTAFEIILPLKIQLETLEGKDSRPIKRDDLEGAKPLRRRILVVEDEPFIREMLAEMLENHHFKVATASNGLEALNWLKEHEFKVDLVITDVVMPKKDGVWLYREIKKIDPQLPVLFISGYADQVLQKYGFDEESFKILKKPFTFRELLEHIQKILAD